MPLVAGVDSSTGSTKVEVRDLDTGRLFASGRGAHPSTAPPRSEQHPQVWWQAFHEAWNSCANPPIAAISVAAQQHGMVVVDDEGIPLRPAKLWNDTESAGQARALVERWGPERWAQSCGSVPTASFTITKLAWLAEREPEVLARTREVLLPHDWLTKMICGNSVTDRGDASGTGYYSTRNGNWHFDALTLVDERLPWDRMLPEILPPNTSAGYPSKRACESLGLRARTLVGPGTGDNMAAALGLGLRTGDIAISIGTSGTIYAQTFHPVSDSTGAVAGFADASENFLPLVCTMNATKVTDTFSRFLGLQSDAFDDLVLSTPPGAGGVVLVPYLDGERTPNRPHSTGTLLGLRSSTIAGQIARAAVEGVVCGLLDGLDALRRAGAADNGRLFLIGGGARSVAFRHVLADLSSRPVILPDPDQEHTARGAAIQAASVLEGSKPQEIIERWSPPDSITIEPDPNTDFLSVRQAFAAARDSDIASHR